MPQEPFCGLLVNERGKASAFRPSPGMQLDYMMAVIDAFFEKMASSSLLQQTHNTPSGYQQNFTGPKQLGQRVRDINTIEV